MSDEFLPPSGPPVESEPSLPDPDENGLGYYAVEEYSGDPSAGPAAGPLFPRDDRLTTSPLGSRSRSEQVSGPEPDRHSRRESRRDKRREPASPSSPFDPPIIEAAPVDTAEVAGDSAPTRSGRVPFAERNWRVPVIAVLLAAMVVLVAFILLLPDDGLEEQGSTGVINLREQPEKRWDEDLDGFASSVASDDTSMYVVVVKPTVTELIAFDLATGDERWATEVGPAGASATGSVAVVEDGLAVVLSTSSTGEGSFAMVDPANGKISWQRAVDVPLSAVESDSVISGPGSDAGFELASIDHSEKRVGEPVRVDAFFFVDDVVYLDSEGVLTLADADTLQPDEDFRYPHDGSIIDPVRLGDDVVFGLGERVVRVAGDGTEKFSFDPEVGLIRDVKEMSGDRVLVSSATRMRVVDLDDDGAEASTAVRSGVAPILIHDIEGDEFIVVFDGAATGTGAATVRVLRVEGDDFDQVSEIEIVSSDGAPPVTVTATTAYVSSFGARPQLVVFDIVTGDRLWSVSVGKQDVVTVGSEGVVVLAREDDESVVSFYSSTE